VRTLQPPLSFQPSAMAFQMMPGFGIPMAQHVGKAASPLRGPWSYSRTGPGWMI
jgi:hypothetical protein